MRYLEYRDAVIIIQVNTMVLFYCILLHIQFMPGYCALSLQQAMWRGVQVRNRLPQYRKERQEREVQYSNSH